MNSTSKSVPAWLHALLCVCLLSTGSGSLAQSLEVETHESLSTRVVQLEELFGSLDNQARNCLENTPKAKLDNPACQALLDAIDGEPIATYLQHCRSLRNWRDEFVSNYQQSVEAEQPDNDAILHLLVQTEYYCADNALSQHSDYVVAAFNELNSRPVETGNRVERSTLPASSAQLETRRMNERLRRETEQQWRSLELELLRQRLENR